MKNSQDLKLLIFTMGKLHLALPVEAVQKVISYTPIYSSGLSHHGVVHVGDREITTIDLHKRLFKTSETQNENTGYLILAKNSINEQFAILVAAIPTLINVPLSNIRVLPESYRRADTLDIATHVTIIPESTGNITVFLLDVDELVPPILSSTGSQVK